MYFYGQAEARLVVDADIQGYFAAGPGGVISPLLFNIYLNKLDRIWAAHCSSLGVTHLALTW